MRSLNSKIPYQVHPAKCGLCLLVLMTSGCSTWSWQGQFKDGERLTRVIHAENARLKDLVVQLRSSNEDMAQRALDDSARIAKLEEENQVLTGSVASYQSERERMAKAFQNLQQQVQVALTDRSVVAASTREDDKPLARLKVDDSSQATPPPDGQFDVEKRQLVLSLDSWFTGDSAIVTNDQETRLTRLAGWIEMQAAHSPPARPIVARAVGPRQDQLMRVALPGSPPVPDLVEGKADLDQARAKRLWEGLSQKLRADLAARILFEDKPKSGAPSGLEATRSSIVLQF